MIFESPTFEDIAHLLAAWRIWFLGALIGGLLAAGIYLAYPPPFRARATVLVDQNVEQVILEEQNDLRNYTYLQRETDKLIEVVWADATISLVAEQTGISVPDLRDGRLTLSQPSDGGWHFYADSPNPETAAALASAWAMAFSDQVQAGSAGISSLTEVNPTQVSNLPVSRSTPVGVYLFGGSLAGVALTAFSVLFFHRKETQ